MQITVQNIERYFHYLPYIFIVTVITSLGGLLLIFREKCQLPDTVQCRIRRPLQYGACPCLPDIQHFIMACFYGAGFGGLWKRAAVGTGTDAGYQQFCIPAGFCRHYLPYQLFGLQSEHFKYVV